MELDTAHERPPANPPSPPSTGQGAEQVESLPRTLDFDQPQPSAKPRSSKSSPRKGGLVPEPEPDEPEEPEKEEPEPELEESTSEKVRHGGSASSLYEVSSDESEDEFPPASTVLDFQIKLKRKADPRYSLAQCSVIPHTIHQPGTIRFSIGDDRVDFDVSNRYSVKSYKRRGVSFLLKLQLRNADASLSDFESVRCKCEVDPNESAAAGDEFAAALMSIPAIRICARSERAS